MGPLMILDLHSASRVVKLLPFLPDWLTLNVSVLIGNKP